MTTSGPDGPMINRRNTVKDDHVTVDVTHEEDEATSSGLKPGDIVESQDPIGRRGRVQPNGTVKWFETTEPLADENGWAVGPIPFTLVDDPRYQKLREASRSNWPETDTTVGERVFETGMRLLDDASTAELLSALAISVERTNAIKIPVQALEDLLVQATNAFQPKSTLADRVEKKAREIRASETISRMETLDEISSEMLALGDRFDPETERFSRKQMQVHVGNIAYNLHRLADVMKGRISG